MPETPTCPICGGEKTGVSRFDCEGRIIECADIRCGGCSLPAHNWPAVQALKDDSERLKRIIATASGKDAESFDWSVLGEIDRLEQENRTLRDRLNHLEPVNAAAIDLLAMMDAVCIDPSLGDETDRVFANWEFDDLRAALNLEGKQSQPQAEPIGCPTPGACSCPGYEAERADDGELIRDCYADSPLDWIDPWLLEVGFKPDDQQDYLWINTPVGGMFDIQAMAAGPWHLADPDNEIEIPRPKTRGDVRNLCKALGIDLKQPSEPAE